ncbi:MAG: S8 family serine peptidase [Ideonella sp.]|nr:S8 family serine peptidase [Ideonella sp.]MCC7455649.1 S8 family serine peptidase [Nitrospira sp.]
MPGLRTHLLSAACALLIACGGGSAASDSEDTAEFAVADEVVVKLLRTQDLPALLAEYGLSRIDQFGSRPIYRLRGAAGTDVESLVERLVADARVQFAEPNLLVEDPEGQRASYWFIGGDAGTYATQWNTRALRLAEAHAVADGSGMTVATLDTGVDPAHPALAGRLIAGFDFVDLDADPSEVGAAGDRGYGHGTHVASLVAQVAPGARIMPLRVLDTHGVGNIWALSEALLYAIDPDGDPTTADGAQIINMSLGTLRRTALLDDIGDRASCTLDDDDEDRQRCTVQGGALIVSAAGNSGDTTPLYPAAEEGDRALAVAASTEAGALAGFSTRGDWVQVAAPGESIYGAIPGGRWGVWSGTSMAAPMVAGAAALLRQAHPQWTPGEVADRLIQDGRPLCGSSLKQIDPAKTLTGTSAAAPVCR